MRIRILSDLHLEHAGWQPPAVTADVVVLAGDIHLGTRGLSWARKHFPKVPIVYVPGNHEYYGGRLQDVLAALRKEAVEEDIDLLDQDGVTVKGVRFLGTTLWTDFELHGADPRSIARAMAVAQDGVNDFRLVQYGDSGTFQPRHAREIHLEQARWLEEQLARPVSETTVVVTHHLPHPRSIHARFQGDPYNPIFASDLDRLVRPPVDLWIHGHAHDSMDYVVNGTRVVCNPRGYIPREPNGAFDPACVVEVPAGA
jgi:predicted phosphodiesterase